MIGRHVAIVTAVYPPEPVISAQIARDLANELVGSGARVTVLCPFPTRPLGATFDIRPGAAPLVRTEGGMRVVWLPSFCAPQSRLLPRMAESYSFGRHVCRYIDEYLAGLDAVYANTHPLLSQAMIARLCMRHDIPLVLHIQDLYPESLATKLPPLMRGNALWPLIALDRCSARSAARVVVISDDMWRTYVERRRVDSSKVVTIRNWIDEAPFERMPDRSVACERYGLTANKFTFLYLGNIGAVAGVDVLIRAFHAAAIADAQLVIAGDGSAKQACIELVSRLRVPNVHFISDPEAANVTLLQSLGHVCLLPMRKAGSVGSVPSKLMAYMLSGRPLIATVDSSSDTARCVNESGCGWVGPAEDVRWLQERMSFVTRLPESDLQAMGGRGHEYGLKHFGKSAGLRKLSELIGSVVEERSMGATSMSKTQVR